MTLEQTTTRLAKVSPIGLIYAARALRGFGDGFAVIILPAYLAALGHGPVTIGVIATIALLGSAATTLAIGMYARRHELRSLLMLGAAVMAATGLVLPAFEQLTVIAIVVFVGTVNPSSGDIGMLVPVEHASIAQGVASTDRTRAFARYSLVGALATAAGSLAAAIPDYLVAGGVSAVSALKSMFYVYAVLGVIGALVYSRLPRLAAPGMRSTTVLSRSRRVVIRLAALFSVDAFAGGLVVPSLLALWLFERFDMSLAAASLFFFWSNVLSAFSYPVAAWLGKRFGLINTMVFTHIPSSICLILAAFAPNLIAVLALLLVRSALSQMDVPTRTSYVMAVVTPEERAAAASFTAVPRSLASAVSPTLAGLLLAGAAPALPLVLCGALKIAYDLALLASFRHLKPPEEQPVR
jgi:MFS family permease